MHDSKEFAELESLANSLPTKFRGYIYEKMIGKGGFSRVFMCRSLKYQSEVYFFCAKVSPCLSPTTNQEIFESEYKIISNLDHPNILQVYDTFVERQTCHMILEYCPNGSIRRLVKQGKFESLDLLVWYMRQIIEALAYCHSQHIVHRDIKPENILLDTYGRPKLSDFGISKSVEPGTLIQDSSGSRPYMAPEVHRNQSHDPYAADVWSLGVTFYYMAAGHLPWSKSDEKAMLAALEQAQFTIPKNVHHEIAALIHKMIQVEPEERPTMNDLLKLDIFKRKEEGVSTRKVSSSGVMSQISPLLKPSEASSYFVLRHNSNRDGGVRNQPPGVYSDPESDFYKTTETQSTNMFI